MSYKYGWKKRTESIRPILITLVILLILIAFYAWLQPDFLQDLKILSEKTASSEKLIAETEVNKSVEKSTDEAPVKTEGISTSSLDLPAVDAQGNGINTVLTVISKPGTGKVLIDIEEPLFWVDTQQSIQTAKKVAKEITGIDTDKVDLEYNIEVGNASLVGGPSAGAALTVATIAALQNKPLKENVMITGTINEDGTIGKVGAIIEKAKAAKDAGAEIFLVPSGESSQTKIIPDEKCIERPGLIYCETVYRQMKVNVGDSIKIEVKEIGNIRQALEYFL